MDRKQTTKFLSDLLISVKFSGMGKYWASEVSLDYMMGKGKEKRVDFMQYVPENQYSIGGLEKGIFICYEVKSCKADVFSGHGLNFEGEKNYLVMTMQTYKDILNEINTQKIPYYVGILVACPYFSDLTQEFENPTPLDKEKHWTLKTISAAHKQARKRSMNELLFCMLRAGH